jgi:hypothetical protein
MVVALIALFVSLGGVSYGVATGSIDSRELKNNTVRSRDLRNNDVRGKDLRTGTVAGSDLRDDDVTGTDILESSLGTVPRATSADRATSAQSAESAGDAANAQTASRLAGLSPASINAAKETVGPSPCDVVGGPGLICDAVQLEQPGTSDVLALASGTFWGDATATGRCNVELADPFTSSSQMEIGQQVAVHTSSDSGAGFSLPHLFTDVPAGMRTFQLHCFEETGNLRISFSRIVAVRLSG